MSGRNPPAGLAIYVYGANDGATPPVIQACLELLEKDHRIVADPRDADLAVAPLLTEILTMDAINAPRVGTLVFHPSLLPRHRGADAIKWAFKLGETYTGVTWFWPDAGIDTGDICEQDVLAILPGETPRDFYARAVIPAAVRTLARAIEGVAAGRPRRVPQQREHGTYEPRIQRRGS
jgi:methionyl-tRNA formyltransferase